MIASPNPSQPGDGSEQAPYSLTEALNRVPANGEILLMGGDYPGEYTLSTPGVTLTPYPGESPKFTGPPSPIAGEKPVWIKVAPAAEGAQLIDLFLERTGNIVDAKDYNDFGVVVSAKDVLVKGCRVGGMTKGIQWEGRESTGGTLVNCHIGPTYQSSIVVATSYGVVRGLLIGWNILDGSHIEDNVQMLQDFDSADQETDVSNFGVIIIGNIAKKCGENGMDFKGADFVVCQDNVIFDIAGSNDGPLGGSDPDSPMAVMHGSKASKNATCRILVRNNDIQKCAGGINVFSGWHVVHNLVKDNNSSMADAPHQGTGILQRGDPTRAAIKNNLVSGHLAANLDLEDDSPDFDNNPDEPGAGIALTVTASAGSGRELGLEDAWYFTDWFGRTDPELPVEVIYLGETRYEVRKVDYGTNVVTLDKDATWAKGDPVFWNSPNPTVGIQEVEGSTEPPPGTVEPPPDEETKQVTVSVTFPAKTATADALSAALSAAVITVNVN